MDPNNFTEVNYDRDDDNSSRGEWMETNSVHGKVGLVVVYGYGNTRVIY